MKSFIDSDFTNVILNIKWNEISILNIKSTHLFVLLDSNGHLTLVYGREPETCLSSSLSLAVIGCSFES